MNAKALRRMISASLTLALLLAFGGCAALAASVNASDWESAYSSVLDEMKAAAPQDAVDSEDYSYLFYDIDKDGVPELITKTGTCEADYVGTVYYLRDGNVEKAGDFGLGHSAFYSDPDHNGVIVSTGHMGWSCATRYSLTDGRLTEDMFFEEELDIANDPDAEYTEVEDIVPGSEYLELTPVLQS